MPGLACRPGDDADRHLIASHRLADLLPMPSCPVPGAGSGPVTWALGGTRTPAFWSVGLGKSSRTGHLLGRYSRCLYTVERCPIRPRAGTNGVPLAVHPLDSQRNTRIYGRRYKYGNECEKEELKMISYP